MKYNFVIGNFMAVIVGHMFQQQQQKPLKYVHKYEYWKASHMKFDRNEKCKQNVMH